MLKAILVVFLGIAALIEIAFGVLALLFPAAIASLFKIATMDQTTLYLGALIGWLCLLVAAVTCLTIAWVFREKSEARVLAIVLGIWWVAIGLWLAIGFGRIEHLFIDALKGAIILVLSLLWKPQSKVTS